MGQHSLEALRDGRQIHPPAEPAKPEAEDAYGYMRVSTSRQQNSGLSLSDQALKILGCCKAENLNIGKKTTYDKARDVQFYERLCEEQESAFDKPFCDRPVGGQINMLLEPGDHIIIAKVDRAFRNGLDCLKTVEMWIQRGVHVHLLDLYGDPSKFPGKIVLALFAYVAEWESVRKSERILEARAAGKRKGRPMQECGPVGFKFTARSGTHRKLAPLWEEIAQVRKIFAMHQGGMSICGIQSRCVRKDMHRIDKRPEGSKNKWSGDWSKGSIRDAIWFWFEVVFFRCQDLKIEDAVDAWLEAYKTDTLPQDFEIQAAIEAYRRRTGKDICSIETLQ